MIDSYLLSCNVIVPSKSVKKMTFGFVFINGRSEDDILKSGRER